MLLGNSFVGTEEILKEVKFYFKPFFWFVYTSFVQNNISVSAIFRDPKNEDSYLNKNLFLPELNNLKNFSQARKDRMTSLTRIVGVKYIDDHIVTPDESSHFGFYAENSTSEVLKMEDTVEY